VSDRPVRVVLDTSSIIAYAQGTSVDVGEVMAEIDDEYTERSLFRFRGSRIV